MKIECDGLYRELKPCACHFAIDVLADEREELRERVKAWTEQDDRHLRYEDELKAERDALRERVQRLTTALEVIGNEAGSPTMDYEQKIENRELRSSRTRIYKMVRKALSIPEGER